MIFAGLWMIEIQRKAKMIRDVELPSKKLLSKFSWQIMKYKKLDAAYLSGLCQLGKKNKREGEREEKKKLN